MKNFIFLLLLTIGFNHVLHAQKSSSLQDETIPNTNISVSNKQGSKYSILGSADKLQVAFGKVKPKKEADEVLGGFGYSYKYPGLEAYFHTGHLEDLTIKGNAYKVLLNNQAYSVGDKIDLLKKNFPKSYKNSLSLDTDLKAFVMPISHNKTVTDVTVIVTYNTKTQQITEIGITANNS